MKRNPSYCAKHSRHYKPSVVAQWLMSKDEKGNVLKFHSDIHFLIRQKEINKHVSVEALRSYIDKLHYQGEARPQLSDDELFSLIEPREVNTITDAWQFAKYLKQNSDTITMRYKQFSDYRKHLSEEPKNVE